MGKDFLETHKGGVELIYGIDDSTPVCIVFSKYCHVDFTLEEQEILKSISKKEWDLYTEIRDNFLTT